MIRFSRPWFVYILRCKDQSLYTGISNDVFKRVKTHNQGRGARYLRARGPASLVWWSYAGTRSQALKQELAIKRLSRERKLALVSKRIDYPTATAPKRLFHW